MHLCGILTAVLILAPACSAAAFDRSHAGYEAVLKAQLRGGLVAYKELKAAPEPLEKYLSELAAIKPAEYEGWARADKTALWINAYNAYTLKAILDHYPVKPSWRASLRYPGNSIRQIPGVWDKLKFTVMGRELTLDDMEHGILRKEFKDPRAHMALVCASLGCPVLREEPYTGAALEAQLDSQARRFLADPAKFRVDRAAATLYASPIFKWFAEDFNGGPAAFAAPHVGAEDAAWLKAGKFKVRYLDYDWTLNEIPDGGKK